MKRSAGLMLLALLCAFASSASEHSGHSAQSNVWTSRYSGLPHVTSTTNGEAQRFFDQGLLLIYAFNHAAAMESFEQPLRLVSRRSQTQPRQPPISLRPRRAAQDTAAH